MFFFLSEQFLFMPIIVSTKYYVFYFKHNELIYVIFSHFIYNINPNHNFNQTYHDMILDKKKKSNHNFNQTHILYKPTTTKVIFSKSLLLNHNNNNYHKDKHPLRLLSLEIIFFDSLIRKVVK